MTLADAAAGQIEPTGGAVLKQCSVDHLKLVGLVSLAAHLRLRSALPLSFHHFYIALGLSITLEGSIFFILLLSLPLYM